MSTVPRFWRHIPQRYNLVGNHCENCDERYYPPRTICPNCRRDAKMKEYKFSGLGKVVTYTTIYNATDDFKRQTPYNLAIIELDEGIKARILKSSVSMKKADGGMDTKPKKKKLKKC